MKRIPSLLIVALAACGGSDADPVITPTAFDAATLKSIKGRVLFKGEAPKLQPMRAMNGNAECAAMHSELPLNEEVLVKDGRLANVFVHVKEGLDPAWAFAWPSTPVTIANEKCLYKPRVIGAQLHQPIRFVNEDPTLHNIHYFPTGSDGNRTLFSKGSDTTIKVRATSVMMTVKCDVHPWMIGYVGVVPHPFHAVTGADGGFELKGVPPGDYVIEAWHEKYGTQTAKVSIKKDAPRDAEGVDFSFSAK